MRVSQFAARAALVCSAAGIVCALWSLTEDAPASATDEPGLLPGATVEVTRDLADIPGRAVDQLPLPAALIKDTGREPKLVKNVQDQIDQVVVTVVDTVKPLPTDAPEVPASLPTAAVPSPAETPAPAAPATVNAVSVLAGPTPTTATRQAVSTAPAPLCSDQADEPVPPHPGHTAASGTAPCIPSGRNVAGLAAVKPPTQTGADMLAAITPSGPAAPALRLLGELLPRSDLPTGRTEHPEPGPA